MLMRPRLRICCSHYSLGFFILQIKSKRATYAKHMKMLKRHTTSIHKIRRHGKEEATSSAQQLQCFAASIVMKLYANSAQPTAEWNSKMLFIHFIYDANQLINWSYILWGSSRACVLVGQRFTRAQRKRRGDWAMFLAFFFVFVIRIQHCRHFSSI